VEIESKSRTLFNWVFNLLKQMFQFDYYEHVFGIVFFIIMSASFYTLWFLMSEQNQLQNRTITGKQDIYNVLLLTGVVWVVKNALHRSLKQLVAQHFICHQRYDSFALQHKRATTITKYMVDLLFYLGTSIYAYSLLKHSAYLPRWFLGQHASPSHSQVFAWATGFHEEVLRTFM
jgi:flagellar biosynthesis protein FlhB